MAIRAFLLQGSDMDRTNRDAAEGPEQPLVDRPSFSIGFIALWAPGSPALEQKFLRHCIAQPQQGKLIQVPVACQTLESLDPFLRTC
jgi:hypothetical protein